jgi:hypothetical protein
MQVQSLINWPLKMLDPLPKRCLWNRGLIVDTLIRRGCLKKLCHAKFTNFFYIKERKEDNYKSMKHSCRRTDDKSTIVKEITVKTSSL